VTPLKVGKASNPVKRDPSGRAASSRGAAGLDLAGAMIADDHQSNCCM
jgi:hypothetical protein